MNRVSPAPTNEPWATVAIRIGDKERAAAARVIRGLSRASRYPAGKAGDGPAGQLTKGTLGMNETPSLPEVDGSLPPLQRAEHWCLEKRKAEAIYLSTIRFCDDRIFEALKEVT